MRAIQIVKPRKIAMLDNAPRPEPLEGEVLVQCTHVALCGSNMGQYTGIGLWGGMEYPNEVGWAGHENIGTIVESRCKDFNPGQLVLAQPEGYYGFAEFIRAKPPGIAPVPSGAPDVAALVVAQPLATVLRALSRTSPVINQRCAVVGQGSMGLIWTHMLSRMGARQVIGIDVLPWRLEWAKKFGATQVVDSSKENVQEAVKEYTGGAMVDFCIEAVGLPDSLMTAVHLPRAHGKLCVFGMPDFQTQEFPWHHVFRTCQEIYTIVGPECGEFFQVAMDMVTDGRADLGSMVTPRMSWEKAPEAFELYANRAADTLKLTLEL